MEVNEQTEAPRRGRPPKVETINVLMLRGYVPKDAQVLSFNPDKTPATLEKHKKGTVVDMPADEARALIRRGGAVRADEATDNHLIQAGLKEPPETKEDDEY